MWRKAGTPGPRGLTEGDFLSWFLAAVAPLFPDGYHQGFVHSSSCTGQSCRGGGSLLPRLEPGVGRHGQPFHTVDQNWDGDTETLIAQTSVDTWVDMRFLSLLEKRIELTRRRWFWRAPVSALPWDWQWIFCSVEHRPPYRNTHPEMRHTNHQQLWRYFIV